MATEARSTRFAKDQLKAFIERIERLDEEKKAISDDIRDVYAEAKGNGFDVKALRSIVRLRKLDADERREQQEIIDVYMHALGMVAEPRRVQACSARAMVVRSAPLKRRSASPARPIGRNAPQDAGRPSLTPAGGGRRPGTRISLFGSGAAWRRPRPP